MLFSVLLYCSLGIFIIGMGYRISTWFTRNTGIFSKKTTTRKRVWAASTGIVHVLFSYKLLLLIKVFILDVVLQLRVLRENFLRWLTHMLIFGGFMLLLLMHALDDVITMKFFSDYASTINPYLFLREVAGIAVITGVILALFRRFILKVPRLSTNARDIYAIVILGVIMLSGFFLEGAKIISNSDFQRMVEDWSDTSEPAEIQALESYWVSNFGVVSDRVAPPFTEEVLAKGEELHEMSCAGCHSQPQWAFAGYGLGKSMSPVADLLERKNASGFFWYIHIVACFLGLAYLPFSKMLHILTTPLSLLVNAVSENKWSNPAHIATRQAMELDACTGCDTCSLRCSASVSSEILENPYALPSKRMAALRNMAAGKKLETAEIKAIREGIYLCTNCDRCTVVCPAGINLRDLWLSVREDLIQGEEPEPMTLTQLSFFRGLNNENLKDYVDYEKPASVAIRCLTNGKGKNPETKNYITLNRSNGGEKFQKGPQGDFSYCFSCQNCTSVCPVVGNYEKPAEALGLLPHQILCCLSLGLTDMACSSKMLWNCMTCYQCQEHCPQNVKVTEILYELKNLAFHKLPSEKMKKCG